jgi:hypothetical protein
VPSTSQVGAATTGVDVGVGVVDDELEELDELDEVDELEDIDSVVVVEIVPVEVL